MGLLDRFRRDDQDTPKQPAPRPQGASGTVNQDGYLTGGEYASALTGTNAIRTWDRMRRSDAAVRESLMHIWAPILNATPTIEPPEDPDEEELVATEIVRAAFLDWPTQPFTEYARQLLLFLAHGHEVFETLWHVVERELRFTGPDDRARRIPARQYLTWRRFAQRLPETIYRWHVTDGELTAVTQNVWKDDRWDTPTIPAEELVVFVNEREGDDFTGVSILRSAHKAWFLKELIEKIAGIAYERHGVGIPVGYVPRSRQDDAEVIGKVESMLSDLRSGAFSHLVFPGPKGNASASSESDGYLFEIVSPPGGIPDFTPFLEYLRGEIKGNVLARFAELGHGQTGARSTGDTQSEVWYDALHAVARYVGDVHQPAIERLVRLNTDKVERFPRLVFRDIESKNLAEFAEAQSRLVAAGAIDPDTSYRKAIRKATDMPPEDDPQATEDRRTMPPPTPPGLEDENDPPVDDAPDDE